MVVGHPFPILSLIVKQFGKGYQQCPGQNLAFFEMMKLLATIVRDFDFELLTPEWKHSGNFLAMPYDSCKCRVKRRHISTSS
jgi:cytochrome P450